jgi:hypothetical protein
MNNSEKETARKIDRDLENVEKDLERVREAEDLVKAEKQHLEDDLEELKHDEQNHHEKHEEKIFIDNKDHKSPNPTTGKALYQLGNVNSQTHDLYEEVKGKGDDNFIEDNNETIHIYDCERFYSAQKNLNPGGYDEPAA